MYIEPSQTSIMKLLLRKKCPHSELFSSVFSRIRTEYVEIRSRQINSVRMGENTDHNNSEYGQFSCSVRVKIDNGVYQLTVFEKRLVRRHLWEGK